MSNDAWDSLVATAPADVVLPVRPRGAAVTVPAPLCLMDALNLGDACLAVVQDASGARWVTPLVVDGADVRRALPGDGVAARLASSLESLHTNGRFTVSAWQTQRVDGEGAITVDQTNESIIVGGVAVVKWFVRLPPSGEPGSPAGTRITTLATQGFQDMPTPWGVLTWNDGTSDLVIASVAEYLLDAEDGWDWAVHGVGEYATGAAATLPLAAASAIGQLAARMHAALATDGIEFATAEQAERWRARARLDLQRALESVDGAEAERLRDRTVRIGQSLESLATAVGTPLISIHGDFHVGQILRYANFTKYVVTDFDGSPVLTASENAAKQPASQDIVSMLASLDHVGRVVIKRVEGAEVVKVREWITAAQEAFLTAYRDTLGPDRYDALVDESLWEPLRLQQECREYIYAAEHLPHWRYVPDMALQDLLVGEE